ncbi:uncharacterized protein LOC123875465 [Maniola jurtina]|uniref:uncharacterized protein LOC123875465 n=1 Tax=Maniola jurtina TaxID=191418 RepID=UPI001E68B87C|nr:uncharacterized protein LOC123875465 [Maniola jurtina]
MEEILLNRLSTFVKEVKSLSDQALNLCQTLHENDENLESARIVRSKLKAILSRFTTELYNYFKICNDPNPDEISDLTNDQLRGEENLAELEARLAMKSEKSVMLPQQSDYSSYSKLPDLHLPEFSGNLLEWHQFWDQFTSNMNRRKLNDVDKLLYLKSSLKGDAARLIDGLETTNRNYQIAVNTLKARYGKENEIVYAHHNALKKIKRAEKMEDCKGTLDEIERHLRVLQSMGENTNSNQMRFLIMEKFPTEIIYEMKIRLDSDRTESVEDILTQLSRVISVKEEARMITQESTMEGAPQYTVETLHVKETVLQNKGHSSKMKNTKLCRILMDCGSQRSYITERIAKDLNLPVEEQNNLSIFTFGAQKPKEIESPLVKVRLVTQSKAIRTVCANVVPSISQGVPHPEKDLLDCKIKENYILADNGTLSDRVDILLGNDYYYTIMSTKKVRIAEDLYLIESEFGWMLSGKISENNNTVEQLSVLTYCQSSCEVRLNQPDPPLDNGDLKRLWDLESIGITDSPKLSRDEEAIKHFNETTEYRDNRYYISWPWNDYPTDLPSNFGLAFGRLVSLVKRSDSETLTIYDQTLREQLENEIIEEVPNTEEKDHPIHYIPFHGVLTPGKPLRIVYDASAKTKDNKSLNQYLYCGPLLLEDLTGLLIKFRCYKVGITADVEKAFLQIGLKEQDRDVTRFLWLKDTKKPVTKDNLLYLRFTRVPFGIISSPFILNATIKHHLMNAKNKSVRKLANDIYVDNVVTGANTAKEVEELYRNSKEAFQEISMNLRQWSSNSTDFMQQIPDCCPEEIVKVLGLDWHIKDDTLHLRTNKIINNANTKRGILKSVASYFDPCGFIVPTLLAAKILLQDLWKMKIKWDSPLPKDIVEKWKDIQEDLEGVKEISLARCYMKNPQCNDFEIHCFTDSSTRAYAAVVYIVGNDQKSFVIGKSRLVPIKDQENLKIPRLELLGVLIGSRLIQYVLKFIDFNITKQILWTDSQIVIDWINSTKLLTPFVARRINEIKQNKNLIVKYVPSELNPADVATRSTSAKEDQEKWLNGPNFLLEKPDSWSGKFNIDTFLVGEGLTKTSDTQSCSQTEVEGQMNTNEVQEQVPEVIELEDSIDDNRQDNISKEQEVETECLDNSINEIKKIQAEYFKEEVNGKETSLSRNLGVFKDVDGILRCKGRLQYAEWSFDKRYPILIPKGCDFTDKIIRKTHEKNYHVGVNHTLSLIRQKYWIPQGKREVRKKLEKCPRCVKHGGGPFKAPHIPALPHERVNYSKPFTFTGIDYLGPVLVKTEGGTSKRWICLLTCLAVRAVHLEVVDDLSAEEGLLALRRMIATRGVPTLITSDNALHFKLIADIVSNAYCVKNKIKWRFIPELAPWYGGFYERLVGLVKHCMRRTLQKHLLKDNQLATIVKEIEAIINTRPLTAVDSELEHVLTPADFLQMDRCISVETASDNIPLQGTSTKTNLVQGWRRARILLEEFKEMFSNRYLPSLRERYSHSLKQPRVTSKLIPKEGQLVQLKGDKNREGWKVGKIVSLIKSSDGLTRVAQVKVGDTIFTRSIAHLYPLEVEDGVQWEPILQDAKQYSEVQKLSNEVSKELVTAPDTVTIESVNAQKETLNDNDIEMRQIENIDETENTADVANNEVDIETESMEKDRVVNDLRDDSDVRDKYLMTTNEDTEERSEDIGHKRVAAVRALEKIREWTRNLLTLL